MKIGLNFRGRLDIRKLATLASKAEKVGFSSFFLPEYYSFRDSVTQASCLAMTTSRIKLLTFASPFSRHPVLIAMTMASLAEASNGRAVLTLGAAPTDWLKMMSISQKSPLEATRESVEIIRRLTRGEHLNYAGKYYQVSDTTLGFKEKNSEEVAIAIAAQGQRMLELAGEVADGVLLTASVPVEYIRDSILTINRGRDQSREFEYSAAVLYCPEKESMNELRDYVSYLLSLSVFRKMAEDYFEKGKMETLRKALDSKDKEKIRASLDDDILSELALIGSREQCRRKLEGFAKAGVTECILVPISRDPETVVDSPLF